MKGLIVKDVCLLKQQKNTALIMLLISVFLSVSGNDASFVMSYMCLLAAMLSIGTITYDDLGNGMPFLFTLPTSRIDYVKSKYFFSIIFTALIWILAILITTTMTVLTHKSPDLTTQFAISGVILGIVLFTLSIMIPINLKFGAEKSRVVMVTMMAIITSAIFFGSKLVKSFGITEEKITNFINGLNISAVIAMLVLFILLFLVISYRISIKIIMKKEF